MQKLVNFLSGKKAYLVSFALFVYAVVVVGWQGKDWETALELIFGAGGISTIRAGISKV
jgi:hypothetical protein